MKLNKLQEEAVESSSQNNLIIAGAGTGKTTVIVNRLLYLLENETPPERIMLLTFSKKAAIEMVDRVMERSLTFQKNYSGTFHSVGLKIIKDYNLLENPILLDEVLEMKIFKDVAKEFELKDDYIKPFFEQIKKMKMNGLFWDEIVVDSKNYIEKLLKGVYKRYQEVLAENNLIDYEDMLLLVIKKMKSDKDFLQELTQNFDHILIDEFQDSSFLQFNFLKEFVQGNSDINIFAVGDDDQSIYSFRDSKIENILNFHNYFKNSNIIKLKINYRSNKKIIKFANNLIKYNSYRYEKSLLPFKQEEGIVELNIYFDRAEEYAAILDKILLWRYEHNDINNIVILLKYNYQIDILNSFLTESGIETTTSNQTRVDKDIVLDIINIFKSFSSDSEILKEYAQTVLTKYDESLFLDDFDKNSYPYEIIEMVLNRLDNNETKNYLIDICKDFYTIEEFLLNEDRFIPNNEGVKIYTYHAVKGLQFDYVIMPYLEKESFLMKNSNIEEDRRVFYVGVTRAKEKLSFSYSKTTSKYGNIQYNTVLPFLNEGNSYFT